jgi:hypothetical protein
MKTPHIHPTNQTPPPSSHSHSEVTSSEQINCPKQKQKSELQIEKPIQQKENHNDCFIEAHNNVLEEQTVANESSILISKERNTIVEQINRFTKIKTICENRYNKNEDQKVLESELMNISESNPYTGKKKERRVKHKPQRSGSVPETGRKVNKMEEIQQITCNIHSVPATGRIVHEREIKQQMDKDKSKISKDAQRRRTLRKQNTKREKTNHANTT